MQVTTLYGKTDEVNQAPMPDPAQIEDLRNKITLQAQKVEGLQQQAVSSAPPQNIVQ